MRSIVLLFVSTQVFPTTRLVPFSLSYFMQTSKFRPWYFTSLQKNLRTPMPPSYLRLMNKCSAKYTFRFSFMHQPSINRQYLLYEFGHWGAYFSIMRITMSSEYSCVQRLLLFTLTISSSITSPHNKEDTPPSGQLLATGTSRLPPNSVDYTRSIKISFDIKERRQNDLSFWLQGFSLHTHQSVS